MATPMKPLVQGGSYYPSRVWTPFVRGNGFTTQDGGEKQGVPKTVSGALIHILDALAAPVSALSVAINPVQSGSGDPSPDNVRPISGWTEAKVYRTGVNVWDEDWELGGINDSTGEKTPVSNQIRSVNYIPCKGSTQYYVAFAVTTVSVYIYFYDSTYTLISRAMSGGYYNVARAVITTPANAQYMMMKAGTLTTYNHNISINYPSTDHDYHAYSGTTITIDLDGTIYGGTLDVLTGVLTVDRASKPMNEMIWVYDATNTRFYSTSVVGQIKKGTGGWLTDLLCSAYSPANGVSQNGTISEYASTGYIYCKDTAYTDATLFSLSLVGQTLVYPLATPLTVQLPPAQLATLAGENNVWADTGDTTMTYMAQGG